MITSIMALRALRPRPRAARHDIHLSRLIVAYCQKVVEATGSTLFVIDRAVNSLALASTFAAQDWGLLCMLDDNEHHGLESFAATPEGSLDDGSQV